ncbi:MAG: nuclear transport factor 2 family protein [Bacteroidota bacterium]
MQKFYDVFKEPDVSTMSSLYHVDVVFNDPVFKHLNQTEIRGHVENSDQKSRWNFQN